MRTLFGAVIGCLLGGALIAVLTSQFDIQKSWPILLAGLVAGLSMRVFASDNHASYLRGGLAALVTVLAMIGGPFLGAKVISQETMSVAKVTPSVSDSADEAEAATGASVDPKEEALMPAADKFKPKGVVRSPQQDMDPMEAILMAVGCLIAYQIGKGSEAVVKVTDPEEQGNPEPSGEEAKQETSEEA